MPVKTKKNLIEFLKRRRTPEEPVAVPAPAPAPAPLKTRKNLIAAISRRAKEKLNNNAPTTVRANMESAVPTTAAELVSSAKRAYYETGQSILTDDAYDILETAALREGDIEEDVGIRPEKGVPLPTPMTSLKKIKPGEDGLRRFLVNGKKWIISEKLDGISALWHVSEAGTARLYLRGDAYIGTDVSQYIPHIHGLRAAGGLRGRELMVRGELVLKKSDAQQGTPARSQVNGWLHKAIMPGVKQPPVRFVAYQLLRPDVETRRSQMEVLGRMGFEVAWHTFRDVLAEADCVELFRQRREASPYDTDGIVIAPEGVPAQIPLGAAYPIDMVAFKMPSADQIADTRVVRVEWNITRLGILSPRIEIEPVIIGGARITFVTGHNAKFIEVNRIGPGATVRIRRSGDVIPIIDTVLDGVTPQMPTEDEHGTWVWKGVHAARTTADNAGTALEKLKYAFKILEVDGAGGATVEAAWHSVNVRSISDILVIEPAALTVIGKTIGPRLQERLKERIRSGAPVTRKLLATGLLPQGVGRSRLDKLPVDPSTWATLPVPSGWGIDSWNEFIAILPSAMKVVAEWDRLVGKTSAAPVATTALTPVAEQKGEVVFTGFRDKAWEQTLRAAGWVTVDSVKKTVKALIIADSENPATYQSGKADKARQYGIPIVRKSDWRGNIA